MRKEIKDLGWGNPYFLLEILQNTYGPILVGHDLDSLEYGPDIGFPELIGLTRQVIKESMGMDYKHVIITAGATQAINSILRYEKLNGKSKVVMTEFGYPFYSDMVKYSGLKRLQLATKEAWKAEKAGEAFCVIDSPDNPFGKQTGRDGGDVYWDAVYHNMIYNADMDVYPNSKAVVGSYSKLLGVSGTRIGWIATNDSELFTDLSDVVLKDTATVSVPSQKLMINLLSKLDLSYFMVRGKMRLDDNRDDLSNIEHIFDNQLVPDCGMFYCVDADKKAIEILNKANVKFTRLTDEKIRLSLGQTRSVTSDAVGSILLEDKV